MNLEISGKIIAKEPITNGVGKNGSWTNQNFIIEHESGQFPKRLSIANFNDKINDVLNIGDEIKAYCNLDARESNGKWYNSISFWKCEIVKKVEQQATKQTETTTQSEELPW